MLELVKLPPPRGDEERPDDELADPVLALSSEDADDVPDDTPEDDPRAENPCENESSPWSLLPSPHRARAPFRESIEGVGDVISPDFCLTIPQSFVLDVRCETLDLVLTYLEILLCSFSTFQGINFSANL